MKYNKWDAELSKMVEMDTDTDNLFNIWHYEITTHYDESCGDCVTEQGWMLSGATDTKEEIHPSLFGWRDYKVTFNGKEILE